MHTVIWTTVTVVAFLTVLTTHEAGHALAMRRHGIPIEEAGLGLPFAPRVVLPATRRRPFRLSLSPWILGAYVRPAQTHADRLDALPYRDRAWIYGAGIAVNAVTGCAIGAVLNTTNHDWIRAAVFAAIAIVITAQPQQFCAYAAPALSVPAIAVLALSLPSTVGHPSGPVGTAQALHTSSLLAAASTTAGIALALAIFNLLPFFPFDGGRIVGDLAKRWGGERAGVFSERAGAVLALSLVTYCVGGDLWWLVAS